MTPSFNQGRFIAETIESVLDQPYPAKELIVVDGGSTDESVEVIRRYEGHLAWWVSEPDDGQADAIVKGMRRATGRIVNWLNSDDLLLPGALRRIADGFGEADALAAPVVDFDPSGAETLRRNRGLTAGRLIEWRRGTRYHQPGLWLRGDLLRGALDELLPRDLRYAFDYELFIRYLHRFPGIVCLDEPVARFRLHDESKTVKEAAGFEAEVLTVIERIARDPDFAALAPLCQRRIARLRFRQRLAELETAGGAAPAELAALVRLHPPSALRGKTLRRMLGLLGGTGHKAV